MHEYKQAAAMHREALEFRKRVLPADHPDIAASMHMSNLACAFGSIGEYKQAAEMHRKALEFRKRVLPADHPDIATSTKNLAISMKNLAIVEKSGKGCILF
jgi:hypothetical protein